MKIRFRPQRQAGQRRRRAVQAAVRAAARDAWTDRHACRLRHQPVRRLRRARRTTVPSRAARCWRSPSTARRVTTVEGFGKPEALHPMQLAFHENHGLQCGFCTPGMLMSSVEFAKRHPHPTEADVRHWLEGNLCRCTGYQNIVTSVLRGTAAMHAAKGSMSMSNVIGIGARPLRKEDRRFLTGRGNYVADIKRPDMTDGRVRSLAACACSHQVDRRDGGACHAGRARRLHRRRSEGRRGRRTCPAAGASPARTDLPMKEPPHPALAQGKVRHVGDPVAFVVAETLRAGAKRR